MVVTGMSLIRTMQGAIVEWQRAHMLVNIKTVPAYNLRHFFNHALRHFNHLKRHLPTEPATIKIVNVFHF
jgi:hypothetical protein